MLLRVRTVAGESLELAVDPEQLLKSLRVQIASALSWGNEPLLTYNGSILSHDCDDQALRSLGIVNRGTVVAVSNKSTLDSTLVQAPSAEATQEAALEKPSLGAPEDPQNQAERNSPSAWRNVFRVAASAVALASMFAGLPLVALVAREFTQRGQVKDLYCGSMSCYAALGVTRYTGDHELKKAYRAAALRVHPDRNPNSPEAHEQFLTVGKAYEVLSDSQSRLRYNHYLDNPAEEMMNTFHKANWDYRARSGVSVGKVVWSCFLGAVVMYTLFRPIYERMSYFFWRKWHRVPAKFDRLKRASFLEKLGQ